MTVILNPYIGFNGNAREAMEFYKDVFGGTLDMTTFKEGMPQGHTPEQDNLIMHAMLHGENGIMLMGSDAMDSKSESRISISLSGENADEATLKGYWEKLIVGGKVNQPMEKAPWGDMFGMCTDKNGIDWMVNIAGPKA